MIKASTPITYAALKEKAFKEAPCLLYPWLAEKSLAMIHSWRGIGKTFLAAGIAQAVCSGSPFLKWASNPAPVFHFDCEMGEQRLAKRFELADKAGQYPMHPDLLTILTYEHMGGFTWNLAEYEKQKLLNERIAGSKLIIIDNLSQAVRPIGREDFKSAYMRFRDWMLSVASSGRSVLLLHHSGKEGRQRGISDIEDPLDIVIQLRRPENWKPQHGSIFEFHFEKTRGLDPVDKSVLEPISIEIASTGNTISWLWSSIDEAEEKASHKKTEDFLNWKGDADENPLF